MGGKTRKEGKNKKKKKCEKNKWNMRKINGI